VWLGGDTHLYLNHADLVEEQLSRAPGGEAILTIKRRSGSMSDYQIEDFEVNGYAPQPAIVAPVAV
ncbi:MAG: thymidylate synthase, partial [Novosphingobium sp.]|uniref:thymidylate synthase n=1 Tax=Novosphingobium sp. TaxID=1874826 RepID=UPI0032B9CDA1